MAIPRTPKATYRLQLNRDFTFADATALLPYLHALGISHCYASPYLKARPGSAHGYDIVDHAVLNPEIGGRADHAAWCATLAAHDMGQILDLVPNHRGVGGADNQWWLDVLEHGEASPYAAYFDIDWQPVQAALQGRLLLPVLGGHYGDVLENGDLEPRYDAREGSFSVWYHEHRFPLDPVTYAVILDTAATAFLDRPDAAPRLVELQGLTGALRALPPRDARQPQECLQRITATARLKGELARLTAAWPQLASRIGEVLDELAGTPGAPASFERLHALLEAQAYRLAFWRVASDEINYRRFFDINDLAGLRMEQPQVFADTHRLVLELVADGSLHGLRIDHPDGLRDPLGYLCRLRGAIRDAGGAADFYLVVEKILMPHEHLPEGWPVDGTTGYDFAALASGLFIDADGEAALTRLYARFTGAPRDFPALLYACRKRVMRTMLAGELGMLAGRLSRIAQRDRHTRDYTLNGLREAVTELAACFPVYRSYVDAEGASAQDRRFIDWALVHARRRSRSVDDSVFGFLRELLELRGRAGEAGELRAQALDFVARLQQYTAPVMAKGLEDTCLYVDNRLTALNDVGADPDHFGVSVAEYHQASQARRQRWPRAMLATSTHDSKRSEDVRARLAVLSELPELWRRHVGRWSRINAARRKLVDGARVPARNDEYLLYQSLLGIWPLRPVVADEVLELRGRITAFMRKAVREAKVHSDWLNPDLDYEAGVESFIGELLRPSANNAFLADFTAFQQVVARVGVYNSLAMALLKLTAPGVPDIYQGCELFAFHLADPDNRRSVDYALRRALLDSLADLLDAGQDVSREARALLDTPGDGRVKLYVTAKLLRLRQACPALFDAGDYLPLEARGREAGRVCCFARRGSDGACALVVAPCRFGALSAAGTRAPLGDAAWGDTEILLPETAGHAGVPRRWRELFTGRRFTAGEGGGAGSLPLAGVLESFPVALLLAGPGGC